MKFFTFSYSFLFLFARFISSLTNFSMGSASSITVCTSITLFSLLMLNLPFLIVSLPSMSALLSMKRGVTIFILLPPREVSLHYHTAQSIWLQYVIVIKAVEISAIKSYIFILLGILVKFFQQRLYILHCSYIAYLHFTSLRLNLNLPA